MQEAPRLLILQLVTINTSSWLCPEANKAEIVSSVGIGMTDDSIPLAKRPNNPYCVKSKVNGVGIAKSSISY